MFGIGVGELIVILFILLPVIALFVFISKAERRMEKDRGTIISAINKTIEQLQEKRK